MNLEKLFETQAYLDDKIERQHGLVGEGLVEKKILALLVEVGECANEWRGFKFWSKDQEPRTKALKHPAMMEEDKEYYNPLLEEYVDGLHFILSIGNDLGYQPIYVIPSRCEDITEQFNQLFWKICRLNKFASKGNYLDVFSLFIGLGEILGFTLEQIENAYFEKNKVNHQRQAQGY